jgi:hypothetical protein
MTDLRINVSGNYRGAVCTHGEARKGQWTPEYRAWMGARSRCLTPTNPKFPEYGGRGIRMCDEWLASYLAFLEHVGRRPSSSHSLDRINVNGHYEPGNVRWATRLTQSRNRRCTRQITVGHRSMCITEWSEATGIGESTIRHRLKNGWTAERAVSASVRGRAS